MPASLRPSCKQIESCLFPYFGVFPSSLLVYFPYSWNLLQHEERFVSEKCGASVGPLRWTEPPFPAAASLPRHYPVSKIVTDRDLGLKRNRPKENKMADFSCLTAEWPFTRLVWSGENTVLTSKSFLTYFPTPGLIILVFPSDTFVSCCCGTRLREPSAQVLVSINFNACSFKEPHFDRGLPRY